MSDTANSVALITARGGSKRVPGKNLRLLGGKPLIAWTVEAALGAKTISRVLVSTDDEMIAEAAARAGAEVPFLRPAALSGDTSPHYDVVAHALDWLEHEEGQSPQLLCLLQPTSPLRASSDIDGLIGLVKTSDADSGFTVSKVPVHPAYMYRLDAEGRSTSYLPAQDKYLRSQDLETLYYVNGAAYVLRPATFRRRRSILGDRPVSYIMPPERAVDIDEEYDLVLANAFMNGRQPTPL
jgi:CMP-N-acetylneuraminic acid synthetase